VQGNRLSFGDITRTLMACAPKGIGEQEQRYFQALETTSRFGLAGDRLTIWYDGGQGVLNL
jgi:heat shock protein HslJ